MLDEPRKQESRSFRLAGSITTDLGEDELEAALRELREEQARLREEKSRKLAS